MPRRSRPTMHSVIASTERVKLSTISQHPENPNNGDVEGIAGSLRENGFFQPIVVQKSSGNILSGNHTYQAALSLGWSELDVSFVDVDDVRAKKIMLAANRFAELGRRDDALLLEVLEGLDGLDGTGYVDIDVDNLRTLLADTVWNPEADGAGGDPAAESFWPQIKLRVPPEVFDKWRAALDAYAGKDDVAKLAALLDEHEHELEGAQPQEAAG